MGTILYFLLPFIPVIYVIVAMIVSSNVSFLYQQKIGNKGRWRPSYVGIATFIVVMLIPTWNILIARGYMYYMCWKDGGLHIHQNVEIPAVYFDKYGNPRSKWNPNQGKPYSIKCFGERCFEFSSPREVVFSLPPDNRVSRIVQSYKDHATGELLGEHISYVHDTWYVFEQAADKCPPRTRETSLIRNVFIPDNN